MNEIFNIYELELGEKLIPNSNEEWLRVPGGWVYSNLSGNVFIPYDNEYDPFRNKKIEVEE